MIRFIYGAYGSGKTSEIFSALADDAKSNKRTFLIVPDQEALAYERLSLSLLPSSSQLTLEILGFSRLYNRLCREYGGLSYSYITKPMRSLLMWKSLRDLGGTLEYFQKDGSLDLSLADTLLGTVDELKANGISAAALELAANKLPTQSPLRARLRDIAMIYLCFDNFVAEKYSDASNDLMRLFELLKEKDFFEGANVYIDSFTSFTSVQHKIIEQIFKTAENVTVTVPLCSPEYEDISTYGICESHSRLAAAARRNGGYISTVLKKSRRANSEALAYLCANLWRMDADISSSPDIDQSIIAEVCDDPYAECEAVASHILELLRGGARCRDIVVIARDCERYRGILDTALQKSNIPCYMSEKSELCTMPAVKYILSALRIKKYNWQKSDVISLIKTGLCDIDKQDAELFEEYVNTWNIHGEQFLESSWTMNPDGFVAELSPRGSVILDAANRVRKKLTEPLFKLFLLLDAAENVPDMCRALYGFIVDTALEEKLSSLARKAAERGDLKQARELSRIYGVILTSLAEVAEALAEEEADTEELMLILRNIFTKTEIGTIPTSIDEVTIGSASMLRASRPKYAFVIGICEGEFPASVGDSGLFSSLDRENLAELGIELMGNNDIRSSDELMYVARAFSVASDRLYIFTHKSELDGTSRFPSLAFNRAVKLFDGKLLPHIFKLSDLNYAVGAPKNAAGLLRSLDEGEVKESLRASLGETFPELASLSTKKLSNESCQVSQETVAEVIGGSLTLSSSSFEKYVMCPFSYYCSKVLGLREEATSDFNTSDIGLFVHHILEVLIKLTIPDDPSEPIPSDDEIISIANRAAEAYIEKICPPSLINSKRLNHLYDRLKRLSVLLVKNTLEEFSQSDFRPMFYELRTDGKDGNPSRLVFTLDDGCKVSFRGTIDRVDIYKNDGKVYIRVVDYKTGSKNFDLDDIEHGINLQMLIYLFTLCRNNSKEFKRSLGLSEDEAPLPAGVVYLSTAIPMLEADDYSSTESILSSVEEKFERTGLVLNEEHILTAMNNALDTKFLAGTKKNKAGLLEGKSLTSAQGFADIYDRLSDTITRIAGELHSGKADATPLKYKDRSPCQYCRSKPVCRNIHR